MTSAWQRALYFRSAGSQFRNWLTILKKRLGGYRRTTHHVYSVSHITGEGKAGEGVGGVYYIIPVYLIPGSRYRRSVASYNVWHACAVAVEGTTKKSNADHACAARHLHSKLRAVV